MDTLASQKGINGTDNTELGGLHVLLADDDMWIRDAVAELLRREGLRVSVAKDGTGAQQVLEAEEVDLLITDDDMPQLRGVELLRRLRRSGSEVPAILISGNLPWETPDLGKLLNPGVALEKPFTFAQLMREIRSFLPVRTPSR